MTAREIVQHLQTVRSRLSGVVEGAAKRANSDAQGAEANSKEATADLNYAGRQGNQSGTRNFALQAQQYTNMQRFAESNVILIRRRGNDLTAVLDSLIAEMTAKAEYLEANSGAWLQASTECFIWQAHILGAQ